MLANETHPVLLFHTEVSVIGSCFYHFYEVIIFISVLIKKKNSARCDTKKFHFRNLKFQKLETIE